MNLLVSSVELLGPQSATPAGRFVRRSASCFLMTTRHFLDKGVTGGYGSA